MDVVLVVVGALVAREAEFSTALVSAGAEVTCRAVADPDRITLDPVLDELGGRRLVIAAGLPGLAAVLRRLGRRGELDHLETAVLPAQPVPFLSRHGVTTDTAAAARVAVAAPCRTVGVLKDDSGHVVVDHAEVRPWSGGTLWVRAYVEDERLCDGEVEALRIDRGGAGGLTATVTLRSHLRRRRTRSLDGRAMQLACAPAAVTSDGTGRDQPRRKRIWWDEPDQWRLACEPTPAG